MLKHDQFQNFQKIILFYYSTHSNLEEIAEHPREFESIETAICWEGVPPEVVQTPPMNVPDAIGNMSPSTSLAGIQEEPEILPEEYYENFAATKKRPSGGDANGVKKRHKPDSTPVISAWKQRALERETLLAHINESRDEDGDPTMLFFKSMGALAKTFPPHIRSSAKAAVFKIMNDLEEVLAHDTSASSNGIQLQSPR